MKRLKQFLCLLAAVILIAGCAKDKEKEESAPASTPSESSNEQTQDDSQTTEYPYQFPLTGLGTDQEPDRRAVAVMINNHPKARPQTGLSDADVVYELLAEGDITRFLAVYQSTWPKEIGPVRSARDYFIRLADGFEALYICHGNSPDAKTLLDKGAIDALNGLQYDGTLFKRSTDRKAPHNSYITFANIEKGAEQKSYDMTGAPKAFAFLTEEETAALKGEQALSVSVSYGADAFTARYEYQEAGGKYARYSGGEQTVDYKDQSPVLLDNILMIEAPHKTIDSDGRRSIDLQAGGTGYLLQKGKMNKIEWINQDGRIVPMKNGTEAGLVPGKTWVNIIPETPGLESAVSLSN